MSVPAIEVRGLVKTFPNHRALDELSFDVPEGSVFGFLGPNGAGKTTTIRILLGLARADSGSARILGRDVAGGFSAIAPAVGFLPDVPAFYPWMTGPEYLRFVSALQRLGRTSVDRRIEVLLETVGLAGVRGPIGGYSRGMKQRLGIAQALVHSPRLLVLDEPTSALDPLGRADVLGLIAELRGRATVFFSTHILSDVERVCDHVAVLSAGRVVAAGPTLALRAEFGGSERIRVELADGAADLGAALRGEGWLVAVREGAPSWVLEISDAGAAHHRIPAIVAGHEWGLRRLEPVEASLEDVFVGILKDGGPRP